MLPSRECYARMGKVVKAEQLCRWMWWERKDEEGERKETKSQRRLRWMIIFLLLSVDRSLHSFCTNEWKEMKDGWMGLNSEPIESLNNNKKRRRKSHKTCFLQTSVYFMFIPFFFLPFCILFLSYEIQVSIHHLLVAVFFQLFFHSFSIFLSFLLSFTLPFSLFLSFIRSIFFFLPLHHHSCVNLEPFLEAFFLYF